MLVVGVDGRLGGSAPAMASTPAEGRSDHGFAPGASDERRPTGDHRRGPAGRVGSRPPSTGSLLDHLRATGRPRPTADPAVARSLFRRLEQELIAGTGSAGVAPEGAGVLTDDRLGRNRPVVVTKGQLSRVLTCDEHVQGFPGDRRPPSVAMACGAIVDALFRQLVCVGWIDEPTAEGLAALRVDGRHEDLLAWIAELPGPEWGALVAEVERQAEGLRRRWPPLDSSWMPRTQEPMRVAVAAGNFELAARVDLALGVPGEPMASVALVEVKSGARRPEHRADLHFSALVESLRHPAPPFAVATYYARTGELDVEAVTPEMLNRAVEQTVAGALRLRGEQAGIRIGLAPGMCLQCRAGSGRPEPESRPEPLPSAKGGRGWVSRGPVARTGGRR